MTASGRLPRARASRVRRVGASLLGLLLGVGLFGAWSGCPGGYVEGAEACTRCHTTRAVEGWWPCRDRSAAVHDPAATVACSDHAWVRVGCWQEGLAFVTYGTQGRIESR